MEDQYLRSVASKHDNTKAGRYQERRLLDSAHAEAEDLWDYSHWQAGNSGQGKNSILEYISKGSNVHLESLPYNTFKTGLITRPNTVLSVDQHTEPDSAMLPQNLSQLEMAMLMQVKHKLPTSFRENAKDIVNNDTIMRMGRAHRWKTNDAVSRPTHAAFQNTRYNNTSSDVVRASRQAYGSNRSIGVMTDDILYQQGLVDPKFKPQRYGKDMLTKQTIAAALRLARKLYNKQKIKIVTDKDIGILISAGWNGDTVQRLLHQSGTMSYVAPFLPYLKELIPLLHRAAKVKGY